MIITLAGKSSRFLKAGFSGPKFLLPLRSGLVIEDVVRSYPEDSDFFFGISEDQSQMVGLEEFLLSLAPKSKVYVVPNHNHGPTYTAMMAPVVQFELQTAVTYCDFLVRWDMEAITSLLHESQMVVPTFSGFHPAHLSPTKYAYCRTSGSDLLELREKEEFSQGSSGTASVGAYFFASMLTFLEAAEKQISEGMNVGGEFYVSLIANLMIKSGNKVKVAEVKRFICLGTPEDYREYVFWDELLQRGLEPIRGSVSSWTAQRVIVTMAGSGTRYSKEGVRTPKPYVTLDGEPLFVHAATGLPSGVPIRFVTLSDHMIRYPVRQKVDSIFPVADFVELPEVLNGQGRSLSVALGEGDTSEPIVVASADYLHSIDWRKTESFISEAHPDFIVFTTPFISWMSASRMDYEFCSVAAENRVEAILPKGTPLKTPELSHLVTGTFWFRDSKSLRDALSRVDLETENQEVGLGNALAVLIQQGKVGYALEAEFWVDLGRPHYLERLLYWREFFKEQELA